MEKLRGSAVIVEEKSVTKDENFFSSENWHRIRNDVRLWVAVAVLLVAIAQNCVSQAAN